MRLPAFLRLLAVAAFIGQLEPQAAAVACALRHQVPAASCEDHARTPSRAIGTAPTGEVGVCVAMPCVASGTAGVPSALDGRFSAATRAAAVAAPAAMPVSYAAAPIPPPPEA